jgi:DNA polymerase epsilon subunit 2
VKLTQGAEMSAARRRAALKAFKRHGYVVQVGALELVLAGYDELHDAGGENVDGRDGLSEYLELIMDALARAMTMDGGGASILSAGAAMDAVERVRADTSRASGFGGAALELIDIFTIPNPARARRMGTGLQQRSAATGTAVLDAQPEAKAELFRARYDLLLQKTLRNPRFTPPASSLISASVSGGGSKAGGSKSPYLQLTAIDSLRGTHGDRLVLGMLTQLEEGSWFLEDINGSIEVDLSEAHTTAGLHTDSSFVIAQGQMIDLEVDDGVDSDRPIFKVFAMGTPPLEEREKTFKALGREAHLFGGRYDYSDESSMLELEEAAVDAMIVILSDVFLDDPRVVAGLRLIFHGYMEDGVVPTAFVLMGSFLSHPFGQRSNDGAALISAFTSLGEMIAADFPQLAAQTTFVVVPGPNDAGPGNILPRPSILPILVEGFIAALSPERVMLGTNPCRLRYMTQEVVLFREDLLHKMLRNCAVKPDNSDTGVMAEHMVKSIVDQAHLCPLPLVSRPLLWAHDHAMWLFPSPHLVVIADKVEGYTFSYGSTTGLNPGSFGSDLSFVVYLPAERKSQQCTLDPAELASPMDIAERTQSANSVDYES